MHHEHSKRDQKSGDGIEDKTELLTRVVCIEPEDYYLVMGHHRQKNQQY